MPVQAGIFFALLSLIAFYSERHIHSSGNQMAILSHKTLTDYACLVLINFRLLLLILKINL
jgi:hypothetical protein